jgi:hypothetical protein
LTSAARRGKVRAMSGESDVRKKHRHELHQEDHGPVFAAHTTRGIQAVMAACIAMTFALALWALFDAGRPGPAAPTPPAATGTAP